MAKGITQEQVHVAADALVIAGERPTVERIRAFLGTGSPNTVTRLLESWWQELGRRLAVQQAKVDLPQAPPAVGGLASQLWEQALLTAREMAHAELDAARQALAGERAGYATERQTTEAARDQALLQVAAAQQARELAEIRLTDLQRLVDQQTAALADLQHRHDQVTAAKAALTDQLDAARTALQAAQDKAAQDRVALEIAHRAAEDRGLREIDRARQEASKLTTRLQQVERANEAAAHKTAAQLIELTNQLRQHERDSAVHAARAAALEDQLDRVHAQLKDRLATRVRKPTTGKKIARPRHTSA